MSEMTLPKPRFWILIRFPNQSWEIMRGCSNGFDSYDDAHHLCQYLNPQLEAKIVSELGEQNG